MSRRYARWALLFYLAILALIAFWPTPVDRPALGQLEQLVAFLHRRGVPGWVDYGFIEAAANVALLVPFGVLVAGLLPVRFWWVPVPAGLLASACIELGQLLFLEARYPSVQDIILNVAGAALGAAATTLVRVRMRTRRQRHCRAL